MKLDLTPRESTPWWSLLRCCRPWDIPYENPNEDCDKTLGFDSDTLVTDHVVVIGTPLAKSRSDSYSTQLTEKSTPRSSLHVILEDGHETADDQTSSASSIHFFLDDDDDDDDSIANNFPLNVSNVTNGTFLFLTLAAAATATTTTTTMGNLRKRRLFHEPSDIENDVVEAMREIVV